MRKQIFTVLAALGGMVCVNAADVTDYAGLKAALSGGDAEIRMAVGIYTIPVGDSELTIPAGKTVIGGFKGGFTDADRIWPGAAATADDMTILDGNSLENTHPDDKHRVATVQGTLEGVVIRNGHVSDQGGGVLVADGGTVLNCIIKGNVAMNAATNDAKGGGAYLQGAGAKLINCVVAYNMANNGYGVAGTGEVINNTITANTYAPSTKLITGGSYKHFQHWRDGDNLPWQPGAFNNADYPAGNVDPTEITISDFRMAETQTTTSQFAVFAAAMDLATIPNATTQSKNAFDVSFKTATKLSELTDPVRTANVGTYFGGLTTETGTEILFCAGAETTGYGLQLVGQDYIYYSTRANEAMTYVSWYGALAYSLWLGGSLPTEGQWEYAARYNGTDLDNTLFAGTDDTNLLKDYAWVSPTTRVQEVGVKAPNNFGLLDMTGNVWEWCADFINITDKTGLYPDYSGTGGTTDPINNSGSNRVFRGGSWSNANGGIALAFRSNYTPAYVDSYRGFRPVLAP